MSGAMAMQILRNHIVRDPVDKMENQAVTVRPSATSVFCVDSKDRYANFQAASVGTFSPYDFTIAKKESLLNGFFKRIALTEIVFPYYVGNINRNTNTLSISRNGGAFQTLTLFSTSAFFTPNQIAGFIQAGLLAAPFNFAAGTTCQYVEGRFIIQTGGVDTIRMQRATFPGGATVNQFQLIDLLGFNTATAGIASQVLVSKVTRCRYTEYVDIVCSQLTYNQELKDGSSAPIVRDILARVYIESEDNYLQPYWNGTTEVLSEQDIPGTYPFTINRKFTLPKQIRWDKTQPLGNLVFQVFDDKGNLLSGYGNSFQPDSSMPDWRMTLLVSED
jgi:hypothetical protein